MELLMRPIVCLLALAMACTHESSPHALDQALELPTDQAPGPATLPTPTLRVSNMVLGETLMFQVNGAIPNERIFLAFSTTGVGAGPCPPILGGPCLDILDPQILANVQADANGSATISRQVPTSLPFDQVTFQVVAGSGRCTVMSAPLTRTVQATPPTPVRECGIGVPLPVSDPYTEMDARIEGDTLFLNVEYSGGCADHDFDMCHGMFMTSLPAQVNLELDHDANGDLCRALISETLRFDLTTLRTVYPWSTPAEIVVHTEANSLRYAVP
jgi:hypothetical protein